MPDQTDVCVVGGGPAGLAAAIALRLVGRTVVVLDANVPPIDKACGEGLMPDTLDALERLGIRLPAREGFEFHGVRFLSGASEAVANFPGRRALGLRRTILHRVLVERATELGVELRWGQKGIRLTGGGVAAAAGMVVSSLVVGADGQNSATRRAAGLNDTKRNRFRYGFRRHYRVAPWTPYMELHWAKDCQLYITPISPGEVGVAILTEDSKQRVDDALKLFPAVLARLKGAQPSSTEAGCLTVMRRLKKVASGNFAMVGDASGSVDAITGEGIGLAVRQASALARAVESGRLADYGEAHATISRRPATMAELMLLLAQLGPIRSASIACLGQYPALFQKLLAIHVGENPFRFRRRLVVDRSSV